MPNEAELVVSGIPPVGTVKQGVFRWRGHDDFNTAWYGQAMRCTEIAVLSGYVGADAIAVLNQVVKKNSSIESFQLCVGMAKFDGLAKSQFDALKDLQETLTESGRGDVYVASPWKFHGKVSIFRDSGGPTGAIVGSSNVSALLPPHQPYQYECDVLLRGKKVLGDISDFVAQVLGDGSESLTEVQIKEEHSVALRDFLGVEPLSRSELVEKHAAAIVSPVKLEMQLRAGDDVQKSHLNVFFGKGRVNTQRTFERPRPWYEVEIQPGKQWYRNSPDFPAAEVHFPVITDDGYQFDCYSSLDSSWNGPKNFRSSGDLQILGRWIKGRLEASGCLQLGRPVTDAVLSEYGRQSISFAKLNGGTWFADFSRPG